MTAALATDRLPQRDLINLIAVEIITQHTHITEILQNWFQNEERRKKFYWQPASSKFEVLGARFDADAIDRHK